MRSAKQDQLELNLTPMVDVVLLLLCFFVISSVFVDEHTATKSDNQVLHTQQSAVTNQLSENAQIIELLADGKVTIQGQWYTLQNKHEIIDALADLATQQYELVISAAAKTPHLLVVTLMEICTELGYTKLRVALTHHKESSPTLPSID